MRGPSGLAYDVQRDEYWCNACETLIPGRVYVTEGHRCRPRPLDLGPRPRGAGGSAEGMLSDPRFNPPLTRNRIAEAIADMEHIR